MRAIMISIVVLGSFVAGGAAWGQDWGKVLKAAKAPLSEAIAKALGEAKDGVATGGEIEDEGGKIRYTVDVAVGTKKVEYVFDASNWALLDKSSEDEDQSAMVKAAKITLTQMIETALQLTPGRVVHAEILPSDRPQAVVKIFDDGKLTKVTLDAVAGYVRKGETEIIPATAQDTRPERRSPVAEDEKPFTSTFGEDEKDFVPTGSNAFFILEPGWQTELEKVEGGKKLTILTTVLEETKKIAGVDCRAVEVRETLDGQLKELTRDYFVISKKTNNVYYFGEDVNVYKDGKVVGHEGAWLAGEKGARYGLFMAAIPLLGARYYQEIAPGIAMDRGEVVSLTDKFETPAGKFDDVLKVIETSEIEKGEHEPNYYVKGIGCVGDDEAKLVRYGKVKK